jgi:hypothetical protein
MTSQWLPCLLYQPFWYNVSVGLFPLEVTVLFKGKCNTYIVVSFAQTFVYYYSQSALVQYKRCCLNKLIFLFETSGHFAEFGLKSPLKCIDVC